MTTSSKAVKLTDSHGRGPRRYASKVDLLLDMHEAPVNPNGVAMKLRHSAALLMVVLGLAATSGALAETQDAIQSKVIKTEAGDVVLVQTVVVEAAVRDVWNAYATSDGWMAWASPLADVDIRAGGTIRTHYGPDAKIGDVGTNTLHVVNYVPERLLTLRAELSERWPDVMKEDEGKLMNVIVFEPMGERRTRVLSYGVGYRDVPAYDK